MAVHEKHCTLNPARDCRVCGLIGASMHVGAERMAALVAMLPDATEYNTAAMFSGCDCPSWIDGHAEGCKDPYVRLARELSKAMLVLRKEVDNCPACIMAALRQAKIPVPMADGFDFKSEMQNIFAERAPQRGDDY